MQLQSSSRQSYVRPVTIKLSATEEKKINRVPSAWFATLALVLIVVGIALLLAPRLELR